MTWTNQLKVLTTAFLVLFASGCARDKPSEDLAGRLMKQSEIHVLFATAYAAAHRDRATRDQKPEKEIRCVTTRITPEFMLPLVQGAYAAQFSEEELRQAISFYETETGRTYVRNEGIKVRNMLGLSTEAVPEYSESDVQRIMTFEGTRIGQIIVAQHSPVSDAVREQARPLLFKIFRECENMGG